MLSVGVRGASAEKFEKAIRAICPDARVEKCDDPEEERNIFVFFRREDKGMFLSAAAVAMAFGGYVGTDTMDRPLRARDLEYLRELIEFLD